MKQQESTSHESYPDTHHDLYSKTTFGFWVYLLTDFVLFGTLFAVYAVLQMSTYGGPSGRELFSLPYALVESILLLTSSFTVGLGGVFAHRKNAKGTIAAFVCAFVLGAVFFGMQLNEFSELIKGNNSWERSAFLSAYFSLVGTHALHMVFALLWVVVLLIPVFREGVTANSIRRLTCLKMFWQFLNIIWIFIFTIVYLMGR